MGVLERGLATTSQTYQSHPSSDEAARESVPTIPRPATKVSARTSRDQFPTSGRGSACARFISMTVCLEVDGGENIRRIIVALGMRLEGSRVPELSNISCHPHQLSALRVRSSSSLMIPGICNLLFAGDPGVSGCRYTSGAFATGEQNTWLRYIRYRAM